MDNNKFIKMDCDTFEEIEAFSQLILKLVERGLTFEATISKGRATIVLTGGF